MQTMKVFDSDLSSIVLASQLTALESIGKERSTLVRVRQAGNTSEAAQKVTGLALLQVFTQY